MHIYITNKCLLTAQYTPNHISLLFLIDDISYACYCVYRDDPDDLPIFLISNNHKESCVLKVEADNIFAAVG